MFNPQPHVQVLPITSTQACYVIDDALAEPERWVQLACEHRARFADSPHNAYPGPELRLPDALSQPLARFFDAHLRHRLGARRTRSMYSRLSLTTRRPDALQPRQWLCHVDRLGTAPRECLAATVLYLFRDEALGGTRFYVPRRPFAEIAALIQASASLPAAEFSARTGLVPGYMAGSNDWFEHVATVPARFNRLIAYDGMVFHSGDIGAPERLSGDAATGRLTLNGFFVCSRALAG